MLRQSTDSLRRDMEGANHEEKSKSETSRPSLWARYKQNLRKWWWLHLIIVVLFTLAITLIIIYVAVRAIVQSQFNNVTTRVYSASATNLKPDSFHIKIETQQTTHSRYNPVIQAFNSSLTSPGSDTPFLYFNTPTFQSSSVFNLTIDDDVYVSNMTEFIAYNKAVYQNETVSVRVLGRPTVALTGLPKYRVSYERTISQKGLNSLKGFEIVALTLFPEPDPSDNATMTNTIFIPNPSLLNIQMGTVTQDLYSSNNTYLGYVTINNFLLRPGDNCLEARGFINTTQITSFVTPGYILPLEIRGRKSVNAEGQELTYFSETLKSNTLKYDLNITAAAASSADSRCPKS